MRCNNDNLNLIYRLPAPQWLENEVTYIFIRALDSCLVVWKHVTKYAKCKRGEGWRLVKNANWWHNKGSSDRDLSWTLFWHVIYLIVNSWTWTWMIDSKAERSRGCWRYVTPGAILEFRDYRWASYPFSLTGQHSWIGHPLNLRLFHIIIILRSYCTRIW